ncbi:hypothetical protein Pam4_17 [Pseudanabaena phage Pam4]|nr:hypothetical protein Pam4_17 [Pseudanabaena phage Pam4]
MNIRDLIAMLEEAAETHGDDLAVQIAYQPSYPLAATLDAVTVLSAGEDEDDEDYEPGVDDDEPQVLWLAAGGHPDTGSPYAPRAAWDGTL